MSVTIYFPLDWGKAKIQHYLSFKVNSMMKRWANTVFMNTKTRMWAVAFEEPPKLENIPYGSKINAIQVIGAVFATAIDYGHSR